MLIEKHVGKHRFALKAKQFSPFDWLIDWQTMEEQAPLTPAL